MTARCSARRPLTSSVGWSRSSSHRSRRMRDGVLPVVGRLVGPAVVVDARQVGVQLVRVQARRFRHHRREDDWPFAEGDYRDRGVVRDGLRHDVDRVGVVEDPRIRGHVGEVRADLAHDLGRAQRHHQPARSLRLLADHAVLQRDALVHRPGREVARPETGQHGVDVGQSRAQVGRRGHRDVDSRRSRHLLGDPAGDLEVLGVQIDQHELRTVELRAMMHERRHRAWRSRRTAADIGDLDTRHRSPQKVIAVTGEVVSGWSVRWSVRWSSSRLAASSTNNCGLAHSERIVAGQSGS